MAQGDRMEKITVLLPESTVAMLRLLADETDQKIDEVIHEMALERYMSHALSGAALGGYSAGPMSSTTRPQ